MNFPDDVEAIEGADPLAFTLPGRRGRIVVSTSMLAQLSAPEQAVLFAHERSHLRHRHDRFIHAADLAAAIVPTLGRLSRRVRFVTERWADEEAAAAVGDRRLVARAVARAALIQRGTLQPGLALAGWGVRARVEDLLEEPPSGSAATAVQSASAMALAIVVGSSAVQLTT